MFSDGGPRAWKTKKGHSRLEDEMSAVASAQAKGEARASIERVAEKYNSGHDNKTESV